MLLQPVEGLGLAKPNNTHDIFARRMECDRRTKMANVKGFKNETVWNRAGLSEAFQRDFLRFMGDYRPMAVLLFGSRARGDYNDMSDIDLIFIKETAAKFSDRIGEVLELFADYPGVEPLVYTPEEWQELLYHRNDFVLTVQEEGVRVYGPESARGGALA